MLWILIILSSYFLFSLTQLGDKYILAGPPNPKNYSFYNGLLGISALVLIPFVGFSVPGFSQIVLGLFAGSLFILAIFVLYQALEKFEVSRVVPAIGGILPLFTLVLVYIFSGGRESLDFLSFMAFVFLILGSILITFEKEKKVSFKSLPLSILAALLFSLTFIFSKYVYLAQPFWSGFILMRMGGFLTALCFLFFKDVRKEIFNPPAGKQAFSGKTGIVFLINKVLGAGAFVLQNWAIALVPLSSLAFINALEGTKYLFLLILTSVISVKMPAIIKENISTKIIRQKIIAVFLIGTGLLILALK
jgi:drug/metabolite transporter (DMT)-like permease